MCAYVLLMENKSVKPDTTMKQTANHTEMSPNPAPQKQVYPS